MTRDSGSSGASRAESPHLQLQSFTLSPQKIVRSGLAKPAGANLNSSNFQPITPVVRVPATLPAPPHAPSKSNFSLPRVTGAGLRANYRSHASSSSAQHDTSLSRLSRCNENPFAMDVRMRLLASAGSGVNASGEANESDASLLSDLGSSSSSSGAGLSASLLLGTSLRDLSDRKSSSSSYCAYHAATPETDAHVLFPVHTAPGFQKDSTRCYFEEEFEVLEEAGSGSFATVFKCRKRIDGWIYAVKKSRKRIRGESQMCAESGVQLSFYSCPISGNVNSKKCTRWHRWAVIQTSSVTLM